MDLRLKDKRALVTGSSRGLGYATALALAKEGCKVAINGRDEFNLKEAAHKIYKTTNVLAYPVTGDASDPALPEKIVADAARLLGGLDILITNTGGPLPGSIDVLDEAGARVHLANIVVPQEILKLEEEIEKIKKEGVTADEEARPQQMQRSKSDADPAIIGKRARRGRKQDRAKSRGHSLLLLWKGRIGLDPADLCRMLRFVHPLDGQPLIKVELAELEMREPDVAHHPPLRSPRHLLQALAAFLQAGQEPLQGSIGRGKHGFRRPGRSVVDVQIDPA